MNVYIRCLWIDRRNESEATTSLPSFSKSLGKNSTTKIMYRRVLKVFWMHWRSTAIIILILLNVMFYSTLYVSVDHKIQQAMQGTEEGLASVMPFLLCLVSNAGEKKPCFSDAQEAMVDEPTAIACLVLISLSGLQAVSIFGRWSMITGWIQKFSPKPAQRQDFVSYHASQQEINAGSRPAKRPPSHPFELSTYSSLTSPARTLKYIDVTFNSVIPDPDDDDDIPLHRRTRSAATASTTMNSERLSPDYVSVNSVATERRYHKPRMSFSSPVPPQSTPSRRVLSPGTQLRNGLALNPPSDPQVNVQKSLSAIREDPHSASRDSNRFELDRTSVHFIDTTDSRPGSSRPASSWLSIETVEEEDE